MGGYYNQKQWFNSSALTQVRWYRTPPNTPIFPHWHSFLQVAGFNREGMEPVAEGMVGQNPRQVSYDKGRSPISTFRSFRVLATPEKWLHGCDVNVDPPLNIGVNGCLDCNPNVKLGAFDNEFSAENYNVYD